MYKRARFYDPSTGEFTSRDPLEYVDGMSLMRANTNFGLIDPVGLFSLRPQIESSETKNPSQCNRVGITVTFVSRHSVNGDYFNWWWYGGDLYVLGTVVDADGNVVSTSEERVRRILESYPCTMCVKQLNLSGHGYGCGISTYDDWKYAFNQDMDQSEANRIAAKLCVNAVVNDCSCNGGRDRNQVQLMANKLQATVCACDGDVNRRCICHGTWYCLDPDNTNASILADRIKPCCPKKKSCQTLSSSGSSSSHTTLDPTTPYPMPTDSTPSPQLPVGY